MKWLKEIIEVLKIVKEPLALVAVLSFLIYSIASIALVREPTIYHTIISVLAFLFIFALLWTVMPGVKPKEKALPPMLNCKIAFVGRLKTDRGVLENIAKLMKAQAGNLSADTKVAVGNAPGKEQEGLIKNLEIMVISESRWKDWVQREVNSYYLPKRVYLRLRLMRIQNPIQTEAKPEKKRVSLSQRFVNLFKRRKGKKR